METLPLEEIYNIDQEVMIVNDSQELRIWSVEDFEIGRELGRGKQGKVFLATETKTRQTYALKCMEIDNISKKRELDNMIDIQSSLDHPNILKIYGKLSKLTELSNGDYVSETCLVLEYACFGDLRSTVYPTLLLQGSEAQPIVKKITSALVYMHSKGVAYMDLKLENTVVTSDGEPKLTDFDLSRKFLPGTKFFNTKGTFVYLAPEMFVVDKEGFNEKVDAWSLGIFTYELLVGHDPFNEHIWNKQWSVIPKVIFSVRDEVLQKITLKDAKDFVSKLLMPVKDRMTVEEALRHPWLKN